VEFCIYVTVPFRFHFWSVHVTISRIAKCARQKYTCLPYPLPPKPDPSYFLFGGIWYSFEWIYGTQFKTLNSGKQSRFSLLSKTYNSHWRRASSNKGVKEWNSSCHASRWWTGRALSPFHRKGRPLSKVLQLIRRKYLGWFLFCIWDIRVQKQECIQLLIPSCQKQTC